MIHVIEVMANNSSVPYFNWFAEESKKHYDIKLSFVALNPTRPPMLDDMKQRGCDCYWIHYDTSNRKMSILKAIPRLYKLLKKIRPDIVHTHLFDDSLPALCAARLAGVKTRVITKGDVGFHYYFAPRWIVFDKFNNWSATHIIALSEESKMFIIEKESVNKNKIVLIHHGIPINKLTNQSELKKQELIIKYNLQGKIVIGTVARLIEWKGYKQIIDTVAIVSEKYPNVRFLFVGKGEQKLDLQQIIEEKKLDEYVIFTGWIERDYIPSLYGIMDIYLHAASFEPFGFAIAEAMANSVPVVSTQTGAAMDAIEHLKSGYLSPDRSGKELAKGIFYILDNNRKEIGEMGKVKAEQMYSFEQMWNNHVKLYKELRKNNMNTI